MSIVTAMHTETSNHFDNFIDNHWLLPDGVVDLMSNEAVKQEKLRYQLTQILVNHGYELISPPMIEYTESLLNHASEDVKRQTFKIIDQLTGRLMGVRADITPQIARIDAHLSQPNQIARYCYTGHVIYTLPKGLFGSRTPLQLGAEIFGTDSLQADIELLDVLFALLLATDLVKKCHLDMGHVAIFHTLCQLANLSCNLIENLSNLYKNKALPELQQFCDTLRRSNCEFANDFYILGKFGNDLNKFQQNLSDKAKQNLSIQQALNDLTTLTQHLRQHWQVDVSVDLTGLGYHYHTGIVFNVFVDNESLPIVRGGRFVNQNQKNQPRHAIGFSCELNRWQNHIQINNKSLTLVGYDVVSTVLADINHADYASLQQAIINLRQQNQAVVVALSHQDMPKVTHVLVKSDNQWVQQAI